MKGCGGVERMGSEGTRGAFNLKEVAMVCVIEETALLNIINILVCHTREA